MIQIDFFNIENDKRSFKRDLTNDNKIFTCNGEFKTETDIIHPVFVISNNFEYVFKCNYVHVYSPINRYYFVDDIKIVGNHFEISCTVDVLFTYRNQILEKTCLISRYEKDLAKEKRYYFYDEKYPILNSENVKFQNVGVVSFTHGYYLTVNGGVQ